jgi:hypothetical protein
MCDDTAAHFNSCAVFRPEENPMKLSVPRISRVVAGAVVGAALCVGPLAAAPAQAATVTLSASDAITQRVVDLRTQAPPAAHPDGGACIDLACGWVFTRAVTQSLWSSVVGKPADAAAAACRTVLTKVGASQWTWLCDSAAGLLRNLTAPNGRCLFVGALPAPLPPFFTPVVKYTTVSCV